MSRLVWKDFVNSPTVRMVSVGIMIALLAGSMFSVWRAFSLPTEKQEIHSLVFYRHSGEFDYQVYPIPSVLYGQYLAGAENPVYFRQIVGGIDVSFSYSFVPDGTVTDVAEVVKITALVENPGVWQREVILVPETSMTGDFTMGFPLNLGTFSALADTIENEIGVRAYPVDITIVANVHVVAQTDYGAAEDDFVQTTKVTMTSTNLEWERGLSLWQSGSFAGLSYEQLGQFDYGIRLTHNSLYGAITLRPDEPAPQPPVALPKDMPYFPSIIDHIDGSFSYNFIHDVPLNESSATVEVVCVLANTGGWSKTYVFVPESVETVDFTVTFPIDIQQYINLANAIRDEVGAGAASSSLTITADVHTVAETDYGTIDEVFTQSLTGTLSAATLTWRSDLGKVQSRSITETVTIPESVWSERGGAIGGLLLVLLLGSCVVWNYARTRPLPLTAVEAEARRARKKHEDVIVDVEEMPEAKAKEMVISLSSLEELIKAADALLKPVLYKAEAGKHTYCLIDGPTRYQYVSLEPSEPWDEEDRAPQG